MATPPQVIIVESNQWINQVGGRYELREGLKNGRPWWTVGDPSACSVKSIWWDQICKVWAIHYNCNWENEPNGHLGVCSGYAATDAFPREGVCFTIFPYAILLTHDRQTTPATPLHACSSDAPLNVRSESWYSHYRHTVFQAIYNTTKMGFDEIVLVGVQPLTSMQRTCEEFPCLQQDFKDAIAEKKAPFFDSTGNQKVTFEQVFFQREKPERLAAFLEFNSTQTRATLVISCPESYSADVESIVDSHNETTGLNPAQLFFASANDVYRGNAPRDLGRV